MTAPKAISRRLRQRCRLPPYIAAETATPTQAETTPYGPGQRIAASSYAAVFAIHRLMGADKRHTLHTSLNGCVPLGKQAVQSPASPARQNRKTRHGISSCHVTTSSPDSHGKRVIMSIDRWASISSEADPYTVNNERDDALVAVMSEILSQTIRSRISPFVPNAVLTSEIPADTTMESSIVQPPAVMNAGT